MEPVQNQFNPKNDIIKDVHLFNRVELFRKLTHLSICTGLFLGGHWVSWWLGVLFGMAGIFVTFYLDKFGFLNYFKGVKRSSNGHYWMFFGVLTTFLMYKQNLAVDITKANASYAFALFSLGIADPLSMLGRPVFNYLCRYPNFVKISKYLTFERKTLTGSLIYFCVSLLILACTLALMNLNLSSNQKVAAVLGLVGITAVEFFSIWGFDNVFIPVLSFVLLWLVLN